MVVGINIAVNIVANHTDIVIILAHQKSTLFVSPIQCAPN